MAKYLITSALPYINGIKHLGNLGGSMLPADVLARVLRMLGDEVLFVCGTDEHGTPAELAAFDLEMNVADYCDQQYRLQADVCRDFGLSFDYFGRSSAPQNHALTQELALDLEERGFIEERSTRQLFCLDDGPLDAHGHTIGRFLPDRYVEGTCPHCGYDGARGDQCDSCGAQIDAVDLINPRSKISGSTNIEVRETTHLFLLQSKLSEAIGDWVARCDEWPDLGRKAHPHENVR